MKNRRRSFNQFFAASFIKPSFSKKNAIKLMRSYDIINNERFISKGSDIEEWPSLRDLQNDSGSIRSRMVFQKLCRRVRVRVHSGRTHTVGTRCKRGRHKVLDRVLPWCILEWVKSYTLDKISSQLLCSPSIMVHAICSVQAWIRPEVIKVWDKVISCSKAEVF